MSLPLTFPSPQYHACDTLWLERPDPTYLSIEILYVLQKSLKLHFFPKASITSLYLKCSLSPTFPEHLHSPCMAFSIKYLQPLNFTDSYIWLIPLVNQKFEIKIAHSFQPFCILVVRLNTAYGLFILGLDYNLMTFW